MVNPSYELKTKTNIFFRKKSGFPVSSTFCLALSPGLEGELSVPEGGGVVASSHLNLRSPTSVQQEALPT